MRLPPCATVFARRKLDVALGDEPTAASSLIRTRGSDVSLDGMDSSTAKGNGSIAGSRGELSSPRLSTRDAKGDALTGKLCGASEIP